MTDEVKIFLHVVSSLIIQSWPSYIPHCHAAALCGQEGWVELLGQILLKLMGHVRKGGGQECGPQLLSVHHIFLCWDSCDGRAGSDCSLGEGVMRASLSPSPSTDCLSPAQIRAIMLAGALGTPPTLSMRIPPSSHPTRHILRILVTDYYWAGL